MATRDTGQSFDGMSRRAFLKTAAIAGAAASCGFDVAYNAEKALAYENDTTNYKVTSTTCPYCSASCGQRVVTALTGANAGKVVDIYGDYESPMNSGGLCAKGAGSLQLVNNQRRIGAYPGAHPAEATVPAPSSASTAPTPTVSPTSGPATVTWSKMSLDSAMARDRGRSCHR